MNHIMGQLHIYSKCNFSLHKLKIASSTNIAKYFMPFKIKPFCVHNILYVHNTKLLQIFRYQRLCMRLMRFTLCLPISFHLA